MSCGSTARCRSFLFLSFYSFLFSYINYTSQSTLVFEYGSLFPPECIPLNCACKVTSFFWISQFPDHSSLQPSQSNYVGDAGSLSVVSLISQPLKMQDINNIYSDTQCFMDALCQYATAVRLSSLFLFVFVYSINYRTFAHTNHHTYGEPTSYT